tara:strand:+ start:141 stop:383 length:243 start_codon:yes stop_codon:yes gene_type:complete
MVSKYFKKICCFYELEQNMNCWHCQEELIWGGDHDTEDNEEYDMVSNLSCPNCHCFVEVYHPSESLIKEYKDHEDANESE